MKLFTAVCCAVCFLCGCVNIQYSGKTFEPIQSDAKIGVYYSPDKVTRSYTVIGTATASANYREASTDRIIGKLRDKAAECGANAIVITGHRVVAEQDAAVSNPAFTTNFDYDDTNSNWQYLAEDVDRNFVNPQYNKSETTVGSTNNFKRIIKAEFIRY